METLAYLYAAQEYEYPEKKRMNSRCLTPSALALLGMTCSTLVVNLANAAQATTVFLGDSGANVTRLQDLLRNAGYFPAATTGFFGDFTEAAVQDFQQSRGLAVNGIAGYETLRELESSVSPGKPTVSATDFNRGDIASNNNISDNKAFSDNNFASGNSLFRAGDTTVNFNLPGSNQPTSNGDARRLPRLLRQAGYLQETPPGSVETEADVIDAVKRFQQVKGLPVTGFADPTTLIELEKAPA
jgi:peptidoglycan hydrolase-like protein with peptidoglycan-binding domain